MKVAAVRVRVVHVDTGADCIRCSDGFYIVVVSCDLAVVCWGGVRTVSGWSQPVKTTPTNRTTQNKVHAYYHQLAIEKKFATITLHTVE